MSLRIRLGSFLGLVEVVRVPCSALVSISEFNFGDIEFISDKISAIGFHPVSDDVVHLVLAC